MQSIIAAMAERNGPPAVDFDFVLVAGHFLARDENIFTYFEVRDPRLEHLLAVTVAYSARGRLLLGNAA